MSTGTIIFVAVILLAIAIPTIIANKKKKQKVKQFLQILNDMAGKSNCKITEHQLWNNTMIGVDYKAGKLFFFRKTDENEITKEADLSEIQKCRVANSNRSVSTKDGNYIVTERIDLAFTPREGNKPEVTFDLYNSKFDSMTLQGELQLAEKWAGIANTIMAELTTKR